MPFNRKQYPKDWEEFSIGIRQRAGQRCECAGECGLHPDHRCEEMNGQKAKWARGTIVLTVAHLDNKTGPCKCKAETGMKCCEPSHVKAMCQRCHLRYDHKHHMMNARRTRMEKVYASQDPLELA